MKKLPEITNNFGELYRILFVPIQTKLLISGVELQIFNHLSEYKSANDVVKAISSHPQNTTYFLNGLVSIGLLQKKNDMFKNTSIAQEFLVENSPTFLGRFFIETYKWLDFALKDLSKIVKSGPPSHLTLSNIEANSKSGEMLEKFIVNMATYQQAGAAQQAIKIISKLPEFLSFNKMLDLGGGAGFICIGLVEAHPKMKGIVFDRPPVVEITKNFLKQYRALDRIDVIGGDFNNESIGNEYDLIWCWGALDFIELEIDIIMGKIFNALNPKGIFVSLHGGLTNEKTEPQTLVMGSLPTLMLGQHIVFEQGFIANSMIRVGFKTIHSQLINTFDGLMNLDIGRK